MQILKSLGDGVGTAAGVAWPTFGLIFGALGITVGGMTAIILGSILAGLFLFIAVPITIWSYLNHIKETQKSFKTLEDARKRTGRLVLRYLLSQYNSTLLENRKTGSVAANDLSILKALKSKIHTDLAPPSVPELVKKNVPESATNLLRESLSAKANVNEDILYQFWLFVSGKNLETNHQLILDQKNKETKALTKRIKIVLENSKLLGQSSKVSYLAPLFSGVVGFLSAFGSVAGCAAGILGLLSSVGSMTTLAAIPMLGWGILIAAIGFGAIVATFSVRSSWETSKVHLKINDCEELNKALDILVHNHTSALQNVLTKEQKRLAASKDGAPLAEADAEPGAESGARPETSFTHARAATMPCAPPILPVDEHSLSSEESSTGSFESDGEAAPLLSRISSRPTNAVFTLFGGGMTSTAKPAPASALDGRKLRSTSF